MVLFTGRHGVRVQLLESGRLEIKGLNLYYGSFRAVRDISLAIEPRAVTAIIGPSGCGKSTFLRSLNRMHELAVDARVEDGFRAAGATHVLSVSGLHLAAVAGLVFFAVRRSSPRRPISDPASTLRCPPRPSAPLSLS